MKRESPYKKMKKESYESFDPISEISPTKNCLKLRVRVIRLWTATSFSDPTKPFSVEMVFMDDQGGKIQASVRRTMINKILQIVKEGLVYKMTYFGVIPNTGTYRATRHEFKLVFTLKTKIVPFEFELIPRYGLSLLSCEDICLAKEELDYLVDVIGILTAVSKEKEYVKDGKTTKMIVVELTDDRGKVEVALFGEYVNIFNDQLAVCKDELPILIIQFAKIKMFRGKIVMQNAMNVSRLLFNAEISEVIRFRDGVALHGIDINKPLRVIGDNNGIVSVKEEFLRLNAKKTITELLEVDEDGIFVVFGKVKSIIDGEKWWYNSCKCHKSVELRDGLYHCQFCSKYLVNVIPRFRIKLEVTDGSEIASFVLFDSDGQYLLKKSCKDLVESVQNPKSPTYPAEINSLVGREMLFKVEYNMQSFTKFDDSFRVWRICDDVDIIKAFKSEAHGVSTDVVGVGNYVGDQENTECSSQILTSVSLGDDNNSCSIVDTGCLKRTNVPLSSAAARKKTKVNEMK